MKLKILTIDDDECLTDMLEGVLVKHGMEVLCCNSGKLGIEIARKEKPDIIIVDIMLPEIDGWRVCKELREFTDAPISMLSSLNDPATIAKALDAGADDYMIKPVSGGILLAHINNLARRYLVEGNISKMMVQVDALNV